MRKFTRSRCFGFLMLIAVGLTGCESFDANLVVFAPFTIVNHHILSRKVSYEPGSYQGRIYFNAIENYIEFIFPEHKRVNINLPRHSVNTQSRGSFALTGAELKEPFDISGTVDPDEVENSERYETTQSCILGHHTETRTVLAGGRVPVTEHNDVTDYGIQSVIAHDQTHSVVLRMELYSSDEFRTHLANILAKDSYVGRVVDQIIGPCHKGR